MGKSTGEPGARQADGKILHTSPDFEACAALIEANTCVQPVPLVPEIQLHLASEALNLWQATEQTLNALNLPPPFWAFAWPGGQAMARYILDHSDEFTGMRILDFAAGSGIAAIAAQKVGAKYVLASELDPFAIAAMALNARLNNVDFETTQADLITAPAPKSDILLAGDVCYEEPLATQITTWLRAAHEGGMRVLIGDPGRSLLPQSQLAPLATYDVPVLRAVEDTDIKTTTIWTLKDKA